MWSDDPWNRPGWLGRQPGSAEVESFVVTVEADPVHPPRWKESNLGTEPYTTVSEVTPNAKL